MFLAAGLRHSLIRWTLYRLWASAMIDEAVAAIDKIDFSFEAHFLLIGAVTLTTLIHPRLILLMKTGRLMSQPMVSRPVHETASCHGSATSEHNPILKSQPLYDRVRGLARWRLQHGGRSGERHPKAPHHAPCSNINSAQGCTSCASFALCTRLSSTTLIKPKPSGVHRSV